MLKSKIIVPILAFAIFGSTVVGALPAYAQSSGSTIHPNFFQGLIEAIAQKFGLDKTQVQSVVTDYQNTNKQKMQTNMQQREKSRLDKFVSQGKITKDQENLILSKLQDLQIQRQSWKNLTADQKKAAIAQERIDLQAWAKQNNIDLKYLPFGRFGPMGRYVR